MFRKRLKQYAIHIVCMLRVIFQTRTIVHLMEQFDCFSIFIIVHTNVINLHNCYLLEFVYYTERSAAEIELADPIKYYLETSLVNHFVKVPTIIVSS